VKRFLILWTLSLMGTQSLATLSPTDSSAPVLFCSGTASSKSESVKISPKDFLAYETDSLIQGTKQIGSTTLVTVSASADDDGTVNMTVYLNPLVQMKNGELGTIAGLTFTSSGTGSAKISGSDVPVGSDQIEFNVTCATNKPVAKTPNYVCQRYVDCQPKIGGDDEINYCSEEYFKWAEQNCGGRPPIVD